MIETLHYWFRQKLGYRLYCYDAAFARGILLDRYEGWWYRPNKVKGTYRERIAEHGHTTMKYMGYGVDK